MSDEITPATIAALARDVRYSAEAVRSVVARVGMLEGRRMLEIAARAGQGVALVHLAIDIIEDTYGGLRAGLRELHTRARS